jgi:beta-fructofuranosidase
MQSDDLLHMSTETPIHVVGGTGDLVFHEGKWHLFACIFPDGKQFVTHYISPDGSLDHWEYQQEDTFGPDGIIYHKSDWRDPRIEYDAARGEFRMLLAARVNDDHSQTGCVGLCVSKDLKTWEYRQPEYYPRRFNGACECPDIFTMGNWEYLVFSSYTTLFGNYYVKRKVGTTQWQLPRNHRLDSRGFYAAKTAGFDKERYLFGWLPTKDDNIFGFWPDKFPGQDYRTWDWGGSLVIHQMQQLPDGDLGLCMPESRRSHFAVPVKNQVLKLTPGWQQTEEGLQAVSDSSQAMALFQELPENFCLRVNIRMESARQCGLILNAAEDFGKGYYLCLEPENKRLVFRSWLRLYEDGGKTFPYDVELEVPVRTPEDGLYKLEVLREGTAAVAYVNDEAALSFRMYDVPAGHLGLFSLGSAEFSDLALYTDKL